MENYLSTLREWRVRRERCKGNQIDFIGKMEMDVVTKRPTYVERVVGGEILKGSGDIVGGKWSHMTLVRIYLVEGCSVFSVKWFINIERMEG